MLGPPGRRRTFCVISGVLGVVCLVVLPSGFALYRAAPGSKGNSALSQGGESGASIDLVGGARGSPQSSAGVQAPALAGAGILLASSASSGARANGSSGRAAMTADGRFVAFDSAATNLVRGDTNAPPNNPYGDDVFVKDLRSGRIGRVSVTPSGRQARGGSGFPALSADARYVVFITSSPRLVSAAVLLGAPPDTQLPLRDRGDAVLVKDRLTGRLVVASYRLGDERFRASVRAQHYTPSISSDGRYVAFVAEAPNALGAAVGPIYVRDLRSGELTRADVPADGVERAGGAREASISGDGRFVAFCSGAPNLAPDHLGGVFVKDVRTGVLRRIARPCGSLPPKISSDGRFVVYVTGLTKGVRRYDLRTGRNVNVTASGGFPQISATGRYVAFSQVVGSGLVDVFVRDVQTGTTWQLGIAGRTQRGLAASAIPYGVSGDGRRVVVASANESLIRGNGKAIVGIIVVTR